MSKPNDDALAGIDPNRIKYWEDAGVDADEADLKSNNGLTYVGAEQAIPWAWRWVKYKRKQEQAVEPEILTLKPTVYGVGLDLKAAAKRGKSAIQRLRKKKPSEGKE
jgi:hypothetical protein